MSGEARAVVQAGAEVCVGASGLLGMIDNFDRPENSFKAGVYADADKYAHGLEDKPGKRIPKAGVYVAVGLGHAHVEEGVFDADIKGPNVGAGVGVSALGARVYAKAELASASFGAGPVKAKAGLSADTGVDVSLTGAEVRVLGTGFSIGRRIGFTLFGTGVELNLW